LTNTPQAALCVDGREAAKLSGLCAKSLERLAAQGENLGRLKIGRRVVYHVATLQKWIESRLASASK